MKSIFFFGFFFFFSIHSLFAFSDCLEIPPKCVISGKTFYLSCEGTSDTSSWMIPVAYDGVCKTSPELSDSLKNSVFSILDTFFKEQKMYDESSYNRLNPTGQKFITQVYFPKIQKIISQEMKKENPDFNKIAKLNYAAYIIQYDYEVKK